MKISAKKIIIALILTVSFVGVFFVMSIMDLVNKKDIHNVSITEAYELLVVENSINGLIPTGKDYYYLGLCEDTQKMYVIHGTKNWLSNNFDANGACVNADGISVKALAKRAGNYDVEKEIENRIAQIEYYDSALDFGRVLELNYVRDAILKIIAGVWLLIVIGVGYYINKNQETIPLIGKRIFLVFSVASLVFALATIL